MVEHAAFDPRTGNEIVHPVEAPDERALPAPRRADECGDEVLADIHVDTHQCDVARIGDGEVADREHRLGTAAVGCSSELAELAGVDARRRHGHEPDGSVPTTGPGMGCGLVNGW